MRREREKEGRRRKGRVEEGERRRKGGRRSGEGTVRASSWLSESAFLYHAAPGKGREIIIHRDLDLMLAGLNSIFD